MYWMNLLIGCYSGMWNICKLRPNCNRSDQGPKFDAYSSFSAMGYYNLSVLLVLRSVDDNRFEL